ncbi:SDR family oxidoreductase [Niabella insulamsoli]|uniref:SDR family oxidoreductase n=1 Tax=Niabella insulamsoli TaxID=3144874 RepID=UPI0031FCF032
MKTSNKFSLDGKVIIVTGATGVLGHSFIKDLATQGAIVGVLGRNEKVAEERVAEIEQAGGKAIALIADVSDQAQLEAACKKVLDKFQKIDGLVNAAGGNQPGAVVQPNDQVFELNMDALKQVMDLNLFGTLLPTQIFGKAIAETSQRGSIVNISSVAAHGAVTRVLGYSLAKTAIEAYTKWFAVEMANRYGDKLRMNALVPGFFLAEQNRRLLTNEDGSYTDRGEKVIRSTPYKRFGNPDELTGALIWLLSDESTFVNGTSIKVDGGFTVFSGV